MSTRVAVVLALAAFALSCSKRYSPQPISPDAAALFARADDSALTGALVIDLEVMRELGFLSSEKPSEDGYAVADLLATALPALAVVMQDQSAGPAVARGAVLVAITRDWAIWPRVQRFGILFQMLPSDPERMADGGLVLLAVKGSEAENLQLLRGLGASVRAASGTPVNVEGGSICLDPKAIPDLGFEACVHAGPGYFALGTPKALKTLQNPVPGKVVAASGPLFRLVGDLPGKGKGELRVEGHASLRLTARIEPADPQAAEELEKATHEGLKELDSQREKTRVVMGTALEQVKQSLENDADAPKPLKSAVSRANVEKIIDPRGEYAAFRQSLKVARAGSSLTVEATVPESQVRRYARMDQSLVTVATVGVLAAIAIPNFVRYQQRAKEAAAAAALRAGEDENKNK